MRPPSLPRRRAAPGGSHSAGAWLPRVSLSLVLDRGACYFHATQKWPQRGHAEQCVCLSRVSHPSAGRSLPTHARGCRQLRAAEGRGPGRCKEDLVGLLNDMYSGVGTMQEPYPTDEEIQKMLEMAKFCDRRVTRPAPARSRHRAVRGNCCQTQSTFTDEAPAVGSVTAAQVVRFARAARLACAWCNYVGAESAAGVGEGQRVVERAERGVGRDAPAAEPPRVEAGPARQEGPAAPPRTTTG